MVGDVCWPIGSEREALLEELATVIAQGGAWRFLQGPVVAADPTAYPEPWDEQRADLARVIGRTLWHAHLTLDAQLHDVRSPGSGSRALLRQTQLALARFEGNTAVFEVASIGNDDVPGIVSHEVGRAFVARLGREAGPFRTVDDGELPTARAGSIATVYLGLGVIAANAAFYDRSAGEVRGNYGYHEHAIVQIGGLHVTELAFLLAVQATVRDDVVPALDTLHPTQVEQVAAWRAVLDDHEAELGRMLGLPEVSAELDAIDRPGAPVPVTVRGELDERDLFKPNVGRRVFRYLVKRNWAYGFAGLLGGGLTGVMLGRLSHDIIGTSMQATLVPVIVAAVGFAMWGAILGNRRRLFHCASCDSFVTEADATCGGCGGRIVSEIANRNDRLAREEELEAQDEAQARAAAADR
jgi:hypothetical protein